MVVPEWPPGKRCGARLGVAAGDFVPVLKLDERDFSRFAGTLKDYAVPNAPPVLISSYPILIPRRHITSSTPISENDLPREPLFHASGFATIGLLNGPNIFLVSSDC